MRTAILGDTHFGDRTDQNHRTIFANTMRKISESKIDYLVIAGDFLNSTNCSPGLYKFLLDNFQPILDSGMEIKILIGDHEQGNPQQVSPLVYFSKLPGFQIIESPTGLKLGNESCLFLPPTTKDLKCLNSNYSAIFYHGFLQNAKVSKHYRMYSKSLFDIEDFLAANAKYYFFAGVHRRQNFDAPDITKFCGYLGAFQQLSFGEEGNPTGYLLWEPEMKTKFIEVDSPRFKTVRFPGTLFDVLEQLKNLELPEGNYNLKILLDSHFGNEDLMILRRVGEVRNLLSLHFETEPRERMVSKKVKKVSLEDSSIAILEEWLKLKEMKEAKREIIVKRAVQLKKNLKR